MVVMVVYKYVDRATSSKRGGIHLTKAYQVDKRGKTVNLGK